MSKLIIPIILVFTVVVAGVFAFVPIENASTVHTDIMANTQRIDEIILDTTTDANDDLVITCPAASDGCRILEIYFQETDATATFDIDLGAVNAVINGARIAVVQADLNTQVNDSFEAIAGVSGVTFGGEDTITIDVTGASTTYTAVIFIQVEGNTVATANFA